MVILVSGASGVLGYGILRSLRKSERNFKLVGSTIYEDSVAPGFCDIFEKCPPTNSEIYIEWLSAIIKKHSIDLIIPGIEIDMYKWADHISDLEKLEVKIVINNLKLIHLCKDKWVFYENKIKKELPYLIETSLNRDFDYLKEIFGLPFLLKPRKGYASRGIVHIKNKEGFLAHETEIGPHLMAQPIIGNENEEFTTSAFCDGKGGFYSFITLKRKLSNEGFTEKAEVFELDKIETALSDFCKFLKPVGPTNFQFRKHEGNLKLLEINPRISSATSIRTAFGYNECQMAVEYFMEGKKPKKPKIKKGKAVRYFEDMIFPY